MIFLNVGKKKIHMTYNVPSEIFLTVQFSTAKYIPAADNLQTLFRDKRNF